MFGVVLSRLVLTRSKDQSILIGDDIIVTVVGVAGGQVRLGIDAPKEIKVDREEVRRDKDASDNCSAR